MDIRLGMESEFVPGMEAWLEELPAIKNVDCCRPRAGDIGEVEMEVTPELVALWRLLSETTGMGERFKKLFIYVPLSEGEQACRLLEDNGIEYAGLREWSIIDGVLVTQPVKTPDMDYDHRVS